MYMSNAHRICKDMPANQNATSAIQGWPWTGELANARLAHVHGHGDQPRMFVHHRRHLRRELLLPLRLAASFGLLPLHIRRPP
jgi:hypothetical protein